MNITGNIKKWSLALVALLAGMTYSSCDNVIYDDEGDCEAYYHIRFKYDRNMKFADAFAQEVTSVALYAFDKTGVLVAKKTESGTKLSDDDYYMTLEVKPGEYELLAWCGLGNGESFRVPDAVEGKTTIAEMKCCMNYELLPVGNEGAVNEDLQPLFHGKARVVLKDEAGVQEETISLTKNTNVVRVVLQHLSGEDVDPSKFRFEITADNGYMNYDNSLLDNVLLRYSPWNVSAGSADIDADIYDDVRSGEKVNVAVAEMTIGRLMADKNPVLAIYNVEKDTKVLSIPLVDYALLVKGNYNNKMTNQEYLDRQDEYNLTFFLDESGRWASAMIFVNSWMVVLQDSGLK